MDISRVVKIATRAAEISDAVVGESLIWIESHAGTMSADLDFGVRSSTPAL
jgi:hypothetical protein